MVVKQVNEEEIKKALLTTLISQLLKKSVNFDTVLFLIDNIRIQIENVLDPKQNQQNVVNAILYSGGTAQKQIIERQQNLVSGADQQVSEEVIQELQERNEELMQVRVENVSINIPKNVRIETNKKIQEIETLRQASARIVDYYNEMTKVLENEDEISLAAYLRMYKDVLRRIRNFQSKIAAEGQNYLSKTFLVNMAIKTIFDDDISPQNKQKLNRIFAEMKDLLVRFSQDRELNHTQLINEKVDKTQNEPNLIKYYISIIKRIGFYIEINSTNIKNYKFAIKQGERYLDAIEYCINQFGDLKLSIDTE